MQHKSWAAPKSVHQMRPPSLQHPGSLGWGWYIQGWERWQGPAARHFRVFQGRNAAGSSPSAISAALPFPLIMHWMWPYSLAASHQFLLEKHHLLAPKHHSKLMEMCECLPQEQAQGEASAAPVTIWWLHVQAMILWLPMFNFINLKVAPLII